MSKTEPGDPRYEWAEIRTLSGHVRWVRDSCLHGDLVPVEAGGEVVAQLCLDCDAQLPAEWR